MVTERLSKAIQILTYAKKNSTSIKESCIIFGVNESYVRNTRLEYKDKLSLEFKDFLELYKSVVSVNKEITTNDITNDINDDSDESLGLLSKDTIIEKGQVIKNETTNNLELDFRGKDLIKSAQQLLEEAKIDLSIWKMDKKVVNKWDVTMMNKKTHQPMTAQNFQVKIWLSKIRTDDQQKAFENFIKTIKENAPKFSDNRSYGTRENLSKNKYLLELSLPDLHIGKLAHEDEVGENYDTKIAINRYNDSISKLLNHVKHYRNEIEEILLPIGNDLLQIDKLEGTTTAGTKVDTDSRWQQMFLKAKDLIIKNINDLMKIAPVKVLMVSGNHDFQSVYYLGSVLEAYYRNTNNVYIDNNPTQRKYHHYGINLIGYTHGNEEKHQDLGLIMATEKPELWAKTKCREVHLGHFHSRRTTKYVDVYEYQGFKIKILPSLSGADKWHNSKGYMSMKSAVAFLYDKENGCIAEFSHNVI